MTKIAFTLLLHCLKMYGHMNVQLNYSHPIDALITTCTIQPLAEKGATAACISTVTLIAACRTLATPSRNSSFSLHSTQQKSKFQ